jgi:hypothetical protein
MLDLGKVWLVAGCLLYKGLTLSFRHMADVLNFSKQMFNAKLSGRRKQFAGTKGQVSATYKRASRLCISGS